ncbi:MAG: DUF4783 domain-containing protein [Chitinophagaceae bacterium]|jgi:hypothetical protein|nr:DUF4783 domain-containing protein [Chitinophagaceae bacterium]
MKRLFVIGILSASILSVSLYSFIGHVETDSLIEALKQGNAAEVSRYFDDILDMKFPEKEEFKNIGKTQAGITLKRFFEEAGINGFEKTNERSTESTMYINGKLHGSSKEYNLTIMLRIKEGKFYIVTFRVN